MNQQISVYKMAFIIYTKFIRKIIWVNKAKLFLLIFSILMFKLSQIVETSIYKYPIIECFSYENKYNYVYKTDKNLEIFSSDEIIKGNELIIKDSFGKSILLIICIISTVIFITILIVGGYTDAEDTFHHEETIKDVIRTLTYTIEENDFYYYMIFDRMISSSKDNYFRYIHVPISINEILNLPKFETKQQKRENIFTLLGL
jgi:hypothetical protein